MRTIKEISAQKKVKYYINNVIKQKEKKYQEDFSENTKISGKIFLKNDPRRK